MEAVTRLIVLLLLLSLLGIAACGDGDGETRISIPVRGSTPTVGEEAPDDIVVTPGGSAYRANVHQQGVENPWPPIETVEVQMHSGSETVYVRYRNNIITEAGETRNNIFNVRKKDGSFEGGLSIFRLYATSIPTNLKLFQEGGGALIGAVARILVVEVPEDMQPGLYTLEIGIEIEEKVYGTVPCTIEVIEPSIEKSMVKIFEAVT